MKLFVPNPPLTQSPTRALTFPRAHSHTHKLTHPRALALIHTPTLANAFNDRASDWTSEHISLSPTHALTFPRSHVPTLHAHTHTRTHIQSRTHALSHELTHQLWQTHAMTELLHDWTSKHINTCVILFRKSSINVSSREFFVFIKDVRKMRI